MAENPYCSWRVWLSADSYSYKSCTCLVQWQLIIYSYDNEESHIKRIAVLIFKGVKEACSAAKPMKQESQEEEKV